MKKLLCLLAFVAAPVFAKPVAFNFQRVDLNTFLDATYGEVLKRNVVQSPELLQQGRKVSLRVQIDDAQLPAFLTGFLAQMGITAIERDGVIYLAPKGIEPVKPVEPPAPPAAGSTGLPAPSTLLPAPLMPNGVPQVFGAQPLEQKNVSFYSPVARSPEFLCGVVSSLVGQGSCSVAGTGLVLRLPESLSEKVTEVISKVDKLLPRVQLQATFVEVANTGKDGFGLSITADVLGGALGINAGSQVTSGLLSIKGANFSMVLDALKTDTRFKQVASPSGLLNSGEHFTITIGDEVPTLGNVQQDNKGNAVQSVVYRPSGVILDVVPRVIAGQDLTRIEATIKGQISNFSATASGVNNSPTLSKREVSTVVTLDDSEVLILGGLTGSRSNNSRSRLFGVVPWGYSDDSTQTELLLLLTAKVSK